MSDAPVVTQLPANPLAAMFVKKETVGPPKSLLVYGPPGTYKTSICAGAIKLKRVTKMLYVDIDNGTEVLVNDPEVHATIGTDMGAPGEKRINIFPIDKTSPDAAGMLFYLFGQRNADTGVFTPGVVFDPAMGYDTVGLDAMDVAQEVIVDYLLANTYNDKGQLNTQKAWGEVSKWTSDVMWGLQNSPHLVGITVMHSKTDANEKTGKVETKPKLQGSVKDSIAGIPSLVAYVEFKEDPATKQTKLVANIGSSDHIVSKNRYHIDEPIENFDLTKLYDIIDQRIGATTSPEPAEAPVVPNFVIPTTTAAAA